MPKRRKQPVVIDDDDDLEALRRIALARGLGAPYLCDGTCDTCYCYEWEAGDWCETGQCPASECECDECTERRVWEIAEEES